MRKVGNLGKIIPSFRLCPTAKVEFEILGKKFLRFPGVPSFRPGS